MELNRQIIMKKKVNEKNINKEDYFIIPGKDQVNKAYDIKQNNKNYIQNKYLMNAVPTTECSLYKEMFINVDYMHLFIMPVEIKKYKFTQCYETYIQGKMNIGIAQSIIGYVDRKIDNYEGLLITWFGGEPLLAMDIVEYLSDSLINICEQHGKKYMAEMITNGYLLSVDNLKKLYLYNVYSYGIVIDEENPFYEKQRELVNGGEIYDVVLDNLISIKNFVQNEYVRITIQFRIRNGEKDITTELLYIERFKNQFSEDRIFDVSMLVAWKNKNEKIPQNEIGEIKDNMYTKKYKDFFKLKSKRMSKLKETLAVEEWERSYRKRDLVIGFDGKLYKFANEFGERKKTIGFIAQDGTFNWNRGEKRENHRSVN